MQQYINANITTARKTQTIKQTTNNKICYYDDCKYEYNYGYNYGGNDNAATTIATAKTTTMPQDLENNCNNTNIDNSEFDNDNSHGKANPDHESRMHVCDLFIVLNRLMPLRICMCDVVVRHVTLIFCTITSYRIVPMNLYMNRVKGYCIMSLCIVPIRP